MDLHLQDRAVWLLLEQTPAAWKLAESCLEEGACVAFLSEDCGGDGSARRAALAARFGLRLRMAARNEDPSMRGRAPAELLHWGGRPAAIIARCSNPVRDDDPGPGRVQFQRSCVGALQSNGALVLVEPDCRRPNENGCVEDATLLALREMRLLWAALAPEGVRVSIVSAPADFFGPGGFGAPEGCEGAVSDLILFLASRGFGSVATVGADGSVALF
ncbi:hypothetical protein [Phenylobacterium sp.]|uniref:hypothetical protein n=1 Tax=Phenylobacterium sp. TaxID=1871053 RepID=UPI002EDB359B